MPGDVRTYEVPAIPEGYEKDVLRAIADVSPHAWRKDWVELVQRRNGVTGEWSCQWSTANLRRAARMLESVRYVHVDRTHRPTEYTVTSRGRAALGHPYATPPVSREGDIVAGSQADACQGSDRG